MFEENRRTDNVSLIEAILKENEVFKKRTNFIPW